MIYWIATLIHIELPCFFGGLAFSESDSSDKFLCYLTVAIWFISVISLWAIWT